MNIAIIAHLRYPIRAPFHGGLETHTFLLADRLQQRGHRVTLFAHPESDDRFAVYAPRLDTIGPETYDGEQEVGFDRATANRFHAYLEIMQSIRESDFDLVHNNSLHYLPLALAGTIDCPMVTALHTPPFPSLRSGALLARQHDNHRFIAISDFLGKSWSNYIGEGYAVVHNGVDTENWAYGRVPEQGLAVWFGRFCPEKGAEYAIRAARRAGYRLILAGSVYDQVYFDREIAPLLDDRITVAGHLTPRQLVRLAGRASVGLFTSTWDEPFVLVLSEIMSCGTPLVAFASGAVAEVIDEYCGIVVPRYDVAAMARAIPLAAELKRADCRERAMSYFPIRRMIDGYLSVYYRALERTTASRDALAAE